jgi:hypothetical protein
MDRLQQTLVDQAAADCAVTTLQVQLRELDLQVEFAEPDIAPKELKRIEDERVALAERIAEAQQTAQRAHEAYALVQRITRKQFADLLGIAPNTLSGYVSRGQAPAPDSQPGEVGHPYWLLATAEEYAERDKRPGLRTDRPIPPDRNGLTHTSQQPQKRQK